MNTEPTPRRPIAAVIAPLVALPAILAASSSSASDSGFGEPSTWIGIVVGAALALATVGVGYAIARRR